MHLVLLADIHANMVALRTVRDSLRQERYDRLVFLGDAAVFGPQPREALEALQSTGCTAVLGNTDEWLLHPDTG